MCVVSVGTETALLDAAVVMGDAASEPVDLAAMARRIDILAEGFDMPHVQTMVAAELGLVRDARRDSVGPQSSQLEEGDTAENCLDRLAADLEEIAQRMPALEAERRLACLLFSGRGGEAADVAEVRPRLGAPQRMQSGRRLLHGASCARLTMRMRRAPTARTGD